ncbi:polysaccharide deacetylase family protein [Lysinibacillus sp. NPDC096418]|uniref:polysaccharide deacetylase family protein n=1 Tax=Lysinibacillus sp. NPDC096418 TaxID=3364138 RepID=UPI00382FAEDC
MEEATIDVRNGGLVISLDFELNWGVHDVFRDGQYDENLLGVRAALPKILALFEKYDIHATWATVGLLFANTKAEMTHYLRTIPVKYEEMLYAAYTQLEHVGENEQQDPLHFGQSLIEQIIRTPHQEIGTHTFSHFYCLENGQTEMDFRADLQATKGITVDQIADMKSIVFPRNQINPRYFTACKEVGLLCYRGNEEHILYKATKFTDKNILLRIGKLLDTYINISGHHIIRLEDMQKEAFINVRSSVFLRPYCAFLKGLEGLKVRRIKAGMLKAAKEGAYYHLWWHPHNFGKHTDQNLAILERLLQYYKELNKNYNFQSYSMQEVAMLCRQ